MSLVKYQDKLSIDTIRAASFGDSECIWCVMRYFRGYLYRLAIVRDEERCYVNVELKDRLEMSLMIAICKFSI